jgi:hypothetical protein
MGGIDGFDQTKVMIATEQKICSASFMPSAVNLIGNVLHRDSAR